MTFREDQRMLSQWWGFLIVILVSGLSWWAFVQQILVGKPWGNNPGSDWTLWLLLVLFGIGFPIFFARVRLIVEVQSDHVDIRFAPLTRRKIPFSEIERVEARTYRPIREYGGWGIKGWPRGKMSYSVGGNQGVDLHLRDGRSVLLGSREPKKLARALENAMRQKLSAR